MSERGPTLLHELLRAAARGGPDRIALVDGEITVTYGELDQRSESLAHHLMANAGVARGDRVAVYAEKSAAAVVALYAVLKTGAAYVPLDVGSPPARLAAVIADCSVAAVVTTAARFEDAAAIVASVPLDAAVVVLDWPSGPLPPIDGIRVVEAGTERGGHAPTASSGVTSLDLAYVLYTSGSTGTPKGVMHTHRSALTFVEWAAAEFELDSSDRLSSHAPFHFDLSVFDLYAAALVAATVVLVPPSASVLPAGLRRFIAEAEISVWYSVPSVLSSLARRGGLARSPLGRLRLILFAGEVFAVPVLRDLVSLLPQARFANLYGPTETNVCTWYEVPQRPDEIPDPLPIGRAIPDDEVMAVTDDGRRAGPGELGELCVRGGTVMEGYWGDPVNTERSLVPNPIGNVSGGRVYRTGDLVQERPDGHFAFLGRRDSQIKSRGYRIELGEIEAALHADPRIAECAAVAVPDEAITNRLMAFVVGAVGLTEADVRRACAERVPSYMIPESIVLVGDLPRTTTGKVDRRALLDRAKADSDPRGAHKMTATEQVRRFVASLVAERLLSGELHPDDDIIGSELIDSQGIFRLVSYLEDEFGIEVMDEDLVVENFGTIRRIASYVDAQPRCV